ncbi:HYR domain-containing protein [Winogradskyella sp.]|uniref:HYR domain-containing protein n=1 Tax=Winogradskyella sp. TaxID=1883156 RepID=UPI003BA8CFE1
MKYTFTLLIILCIGVAPLNWGQIEDNINPVAACRDISPQLDANSNSANGGAVDTDTCSEDPFKPVFTNLAGTGTATNPFTSLDPAVIGNSSGTYYFSFNGSTFQGVLDEGWLMVLNYVHQAGDNSDLVVRNSDLPMKGSSTLGDSDAGTPNWGHLGNTLANAIDFEEMRLYGQTSRDTGDIIDFTTSYTSAVDYVKTGSGSFAGINNASNYDLLSSHTASIPQNAPNTFGGKGNFALTNFPFFNGGVAHWGIRGEGGRWEVDDFTVGSNLNAYSTIHRVWVRGDLSTDFDTPSVTVQLDASGNATVAAGDFSITAADNCGTPTLSLSQSTFTCADLGTNTVQLKATDGAGNVNTIDVEVTVEAYINSNSTVPIFTNLAGTGTATDPFTSLHPAIVGSTSGTHYFSFNGSTFQGVLDGGWLMVLNYVHQAGDNSSLVVRNSDLPMKGSSTLGDSDAGTSNWGHIGNTLANAIDFEEMRLYGQTSRDTGDIIDFTTSYASAVDYVKTGSGSFAGINNAANYDLLSSHTASIPQNASDAFGGKGNFALTEFPFFNSGVAHWAIRGDSNRWEVDDFTVGNTNAYSTIHRVWVRGDLSPGFDTPSVTVQLDASGNATVAAGDFSIVTNNCSSTTLSLNKTTFTCADLGTNTLQLKATDTDGNVNTIDVEVTVEGYIYSNSTVPIFTNLAGTGTATDPFTSLDPAVIGNASGTHYFSFNGSTFQGVLDEGWLMVLNYVHLAGDNSALVVRNSDLPMKGSSTLGDSEAGTSNWGHIGNTLAAAIDFEEMRLYGQTSRDPGDIIDFTTSYASAVDYVKTGSGSFAGINNAANYDLLPSHTASIPQNASDAFGGNGDNALTEFPFFNGGAAHWGIRGNSNRWEVDDITVGNTNAYSTIHRVWVRGDLSPAFDTPSVTVLLDASGNATVAAGDFSILSDNCGTPTLSLSQSAFTCADLGTNTVQLKATDTDGNVTSIDVEVTVEDSTLPTFTACPADIISCNSTITYTPPSVSDNCGFPTVPTTAPTGFSSLGTFGNSTYFISTATTSASAAFADAQANGHELVTINSQAENDWLKDQISAPVIIGINDVDTEDDYVWQSGQPATYTNWANGEPNDTGNYATMGTNGEWSDMGGSDSGKVVIEYHDYSTGSPILVSGLPSNSTFPLGTTTNTFYAKDIAGNTRTCAFDVTIDNSYLLNDCPSEIRRYDNTSSTITYTPPAFSGDCAFPTIPTTAPSGFSSLGTFGNSTYFISTSPTSIATAYAGAQNNGYELVTINSQAENDWLKNNTNILFPVIIGFNDVESRGDLEWQSGQPATYTNWANGEPNDFFSDYAVMWANSKWYDEDGSTNGYAVIEYHDYSTGPILASGLPSGSTFPVGITTNTFYAEHESGDFDTCSFRVMVGPNTAPSITSSTTASVAENQTAAIDVEASDSYDSEGSGLTYSLSTGSNGGTDNDLFNIDTATGVVTFASAPDYEDPGDGDANNVYLIQVTVTDLEGLTDAEDISITVTDVDDTPPVLDCRDLIFYAVPGNTTMTVNYTAPTAIDETDPSPTVTRTLGPASGSTFSIGTTTMTYQAEDASGNISSCSFDIVVRASSFMVTKTADTDDWEFDSDTGELLTHGCDLDDCSLREAIFASSRIPGDDVIIFSPLFDSPQTIALTKGQIWFGVPSNGGTGGNHVIVGPGEDLLTIDAQGNSRIFYMGYAHMLLELSDMTLANAFPDSSENWSDWGGAILTLGHATGSNGDDLYDMKLTNVTIKNSRARFGGGMSALRSHWLLENVTFDGNYARDWGSAFESEGGNVTMNNCAVINGTGSDAIKPYASNYVQLDAHLTINNCTFSGNNVSTPASAILATGENGSNGSFKAYVTINNSTITNNNSSDTNGGAIVFEGNAEIEIHNSIISGNTKNGGFSDIVGGSLESSSSYNIIGTGGGLTDGVNGNIVGVNDPLLLPLTDNNGTVSSHHPFYTDSPAYNNGDPNTSETLDQIGNNRNHNGGGFDIGAIEIADVAPPKLKPLVFLQGAAINPNTGEGALMRDDLRTGNLLPTTSPYTDGLTCDASVFSTTGSNAIVDWVWVELRDATDSTVVIDGRSALLQRDGDVVDTDGLSVPGFRVPFGNYYVAIEHRNHVGIMTAATQTLGTTTAAVDLSSNLTAVEGGSNALVLLANGSYGMYSGDHDGNAQVQNADANAVIQLIGGSGYDAADMDANTQVQNTDVNILISPNIGRGEQYGRNMPTGPMSNDVALAFANAQITNDGTDDFYEADILISSSTDLYIGSGQVYIDYANGAFGQNVSANGNIEYSQPDGSILGHSFGAFAPAYKDFVQNDNTASRVSLSFQQNIAMAGLQTATELQVTTAPKVLFHIKIRYADAAQDAGICFFSDGVFQDQFFTACGGTGTADCTNSPGTQITDDTYDCSEAGVDTLAIDASEQGRIALYPNPASASFSIKGLDTMHSVKVYDISGRLVIQEERDDDRPIDMRPYDDGVYMVVIGNAKGSVAKQLIKKSH